jgi:hypothetical protein
MNRKQRPFRRRRAVIKYIKLLAIAVVLTVLAYLGMVAFPPLMFSNHVNYQNYEVWSDRTIPRQNILIGIVHIKIHHLSRKELSIELS